MSAPGTKREFGQGHFQVGKPTHCRLPTPSVGLPPDGRPDSEGSRTSIVDPNRTFAPTTSVSGILVTGRVLLYALVDEFGAISQDAFIGLLGVAG